MHMALAVLNAAQPSEKTQLINELAQFWESPPQETGSEDQSAPISGQMKTSHSSDRHGQGERIIGAKPDFIPERPGRPLRPELVHPAKVPRRRLGSEAGRAALLHAVAHIELNAIDLAADMLVRFTHDPLLKDEERQRFVGDWISVCHDEARHFNMIIKRLADFGVDYGDHPAHDGLWDAAISTKESLMGRLAIAPMVLEARGLDVTPVMIEKLETHKDEQSANVLKVIYNDEIGHVAIGTYWFQALCRRQGLEADQQFKLMVNQFFNGILKPPFNDGARGKAGLTPNFYKDVT